MISPGAAFETSDQLFACPVCRAPLPLEDKLTCPACGQRYLSDDGVPCFNDRGTYHGPIPPKAEMRKVLELARTQGYRHVLDGYLKDMDPGLVRYLTDTRRTGGLELLGLRGDERVLDFGCSFGLFSRELARKAKLVVALDVTHEKLQFLALVREQDGLDNLLPVCNGDPVRLPFASGSFDWVVLNAVFEYLPQAIEAPDVRAAHLRALGEFHRVLRPGGRLYLATKNRFSYSAVRARRITTFLPRLVAHRLAGGTMRDPYRQVLHGLRGYQGLLRESGFIAWESRWAVPTLWYPKHFIAVGGRRSRTVADLRTAPVGSRLKRAVWLALARAGVLAFVVPNYVIVARKGT
ncbi:MAG: methyltransferase domain-containing protein [Candidatus Rokuibacteriota bacterium]